MRCPLLKGGFLGKLCLATMSKPRYPGLCGGSFWECEIYRHSPYGPKVVSMKKISVKDYEELRSRYLSYLARLEELFLNGELEPQVFSILREKYEKELEACLRILGGGVS
ncbi:MAG: hypothetical protein LM580_08350 [Thermofilum sp.]|nr:hypothetical protein [Thermofilum sp.]MCC6064632.1 hypothetical protein [Thermofilum sp.]